jgi:hypothetical protein
MFEVWGAGNSLEELISAVRACPESIKSPWIGPDTSFKWVVDVFGGTMSVQDSVSLMNSLAGVVPFQACYRLYLQWPMTGCKRQVICCFLHGDIKHDKNAPVLYSYAAAYQVVWCSMKHVQEA